MADQVTTSLAQAKVLVMEGKAGFSPQIEIRDITGGHQVRITTKISPTQYETQVFNVLDGAPGAPGVPGTPGADGFSPTVEVQDITQSLPGGGTEVIGHKVIITDANGPHIFNVMDGEAPDSDAIAQAVEDYLDEHPIETDIEFLTAAEIDEMWGSIDGLPDGDEVSY